MSRRVWETVEIKVGKTRMAKIKRVRDKRGSRKEMRGKGREKTEKEIKKRKDNRGKEGG